jgi:hypothetical protein
MNVLVMEVKEVVMVDDHLMMVMNVVYLSAFYDDKVVKQLHILNPMMVTHLHYHDDVLKKMVQQILVYNL